MLGSLRAMKKAKRILTALAVMIVIGVLCFMLRHSLP